MVTEYPTKIDSDKVKERIDSYIANRGYRTERMITCERFGIPSVKDLKLVPIPAVCSLSIGLNAKRTLEELFSPIGKVYSEGRRLFAEASVLTPKYAQLSEKNERIVKIFHRLQQDNAKELSENLTKSGRIRRWLLSRKNKATERLLEEVLSYSLNCLPEQVPREMSVSALSRLYFWLQTGEEDEESTRASNKLFYPFDFLSERQIELLRIKKDLYKIKNHTAIVCLDQLQKYGLTLEEEVSSELKRIPSEYSVDVSSYGKLRNGNPYSFGDGLF